MPEVEDVVVVGDPFVEDIVVVFDEEAGRKGLAHCKGRAIGGVVAPKPTGSHKMGSPAGSVVGGADVGRRSGPVCLLLLNEWKVWGPDSFFDPRIIDLYGRKLDGPKGSQNSDDSRKEEEESGKFRGDWSAAALDHGQH